MSGVPEMLINLQNIYTAQPLNEPMRWVAVSWVEWVFLIFC